MRSTRASAGPTCSKPVATSPGPTRALSGSTVSSSSTRTWDSGWSCRCGSRTRPTRACTAPTRSGRPRTVSRTVHWRTRSAQPSSKPRRPTPRGSLRSAKPRFSKPGQGGSITPVEGFDFVHREQVRFRDVDEMGHVNNAVFLTYIEEARIAYLLRFDARVTDMILARVEIDFRAPLRSGDELEIGVRPVSIGTKSFQLEYQVRSGDTLAAEAKTVIVSYDYETGRSVELPETWKEALAA